MLPLFSPSCSLSIAHGLLRFSPSLQTQDSSSFFPLKYAVGIHGYVLVYSIANRGSFELVQTIYDKMLEQTGAEWAPCVIVGNKSDLSSAR